MRTGALIQSDPHGKLEVKNSDLQFARLMVTIFQKNGLTFFLEFCAKWHDVESAQVVRPCCREFQEFELNLNFV